MEALLHRSAEKYLNRLNASDRDRKPVIEPANPKEAAMIDKRVKEYEKNPSSFVPFKKRATR